MGPSERTPEITAEEDSQLARVERRERRAQLDRDLSQQAETWRDTLSSKLDQYRSRRGKERLAGQFTMSLDFERSNQRAVMSATARALEPEPVFETEAAEECVEVSAPPIEQETDIPGPAASIPHAAEAADDLAFGGLEPQGDPDTPGAEAWDGAPVQQDSPVSAPPKKKRERKVIVFPRLLSFDPPAPSRDELAEPVLDRPRIMDVPEETEQIELPLGGISLDPVHDPVPAAPEIETPIQVAAVSQRIFAGITDNVLVLVATAIFAGVVLNFAGDLPHTKVMLIVALVVPALFWTVYHYLFLVHAAATPGMLLARIRLATFEGEGTSRNIRRVRAFAMLISCLSAGLGFVWALVDEDTLCWHDKISRTYLANR